jgi:hypothetical protein
LAERQEEGHGHRDNMFPPLPHIAYPGSSRTTSGSSTISFVLPPPEMPPPGVFPEHMTSLDHVHWTLLGDQQQPSPEQQQQQRRRGESGGSVPPPIPEYDDDPPVSNHHHNTNSSWSGSIAAAARHHGLSSSSPSSQVQFPFDTTGNQARADPSALDDETTTTTTDTRRTSSWGSQYWRPNPTTTDNSNALPTLDFGFPHLHPRHDDADHQYHHQMMIFRSSASSPLSGTEARATTVDLIDITCCE